MTATLTTARSLHLAEFHREFQKAPNMSLPELGLLGHAGTLARWDELTVAGPWSNTGSHRCAGRLVGRMFQHTACEGESSLLLPSPPLPSCSLSALSDNLLGGNAACLPACLSSLFATPDAVKGESQESIPQISQLGKLVDVTPGGGTLALG